MLTESRRPLARIAALAATLGVLLMIGAWYADTAGAEMCPASPGSCPHPVDDVAYAVDRFSRTGDPPPTPPSCPLDPPPGYFCVPGVSRDYVFESADAGNPQTGDNRCIVRLEGATPPDAYGGADVQYRTTVICQKALRVLSIEPKLFTERLSQIGSAPTFSCHALSNPCPATAGSRGGGSRLANDVYVQRATVKMVVPESLMDPWIVVEGEPVPGDPDSCSPGSDVVTCVLTLEIPAAKQQDVGPPVAAIGR